MACQRNRIPELVQYLESLGIEVNIGKNKARGNKGFFKVRNKNFRIDIAKGQDEEAILKTLVHEFAHFVHYSYDKTLQSLDFIIQEDDEITEELIQLTVASIPKSSVEPIFKAKEKIKEEIKETTEDAARMSLQKALRRINTRISRLNKYYNSPTELFARAIEMYITNPEEFNIKAPNVANSINNRHLPLIENLKKILL